jgi:hypothetical protein
MYDSSSTPLIVWAIILGIVALIATVLAIFFWFRGKKGALRYRKNDNTAFAITFLVVAALFSSLTGLLTFNSFNAVRSAGVALESQLNAQWLNDENVLSTYMNGFNEMIGTANLDTTQVEKIIVDSVSSQVDLSQWKSNPKASPLYSALIEAYPKLTLSQYSQVIAYISQGRSAFQTQQSQLLSLLGQYDQWRESGVIIHPAEVAVFGFPSNVLTVTIGGKTLHGAAAEAQMWNIVRNPSVEAEFISGLATPLSVSK